MMCNFTEFRKLVDYFIAEYEAQCKLGRKPSQIKIRLDCVLNGLMSCFNTFVKGKPTDIIFEVSIDEKDY